MIEQAKQENEKEAKKLERELKMKVGPKNTKKSYISQTFVSQCKKKCNKKKLNDEISKADSQIDKPLTVTKCVPFNFHCVPR